MKCFKTSCFVFLIIIFAVILINFGFYNNTSAQSVCDCSDWSTCLNGLQSRTCSGSCYGTSVIQACLTSVTPLPTKEAIPSNYCTDSDGGNFPSIRGTVNFMYNGVLTTISDSCYNTTTLNERTCNGTSLASILTNCPNACSDGACVLTTPTTPTTIISVPSAPSTATLSAVGTKRTLSWSPVDGATSYLYKRYDNGVYAGQATRSASLPTTITGTILSVGTHYYDIYAINSNGTSPAKRTNEIVITSDDGNKSALSITYTPTGNWVRGTDTKTVNWPISAFSTVTKQSDAVEVWLCTQSNFTVGKTVAKTAMDHCSIKLGYRGNTGSATFSVPTLAINNTTYYFYVRQAYDKYNTFAGNGFSGPVTVTTGTITPTTVTYTPTGNWVRGTDKTLNWTKGSFTTNVDILLCTQSNVTGNCTLIYNSENSGSFRFSLSDSFGTLNSLTAGTYYFYVRQAGNYANDYAGNAFSGPVTITNTATTGTWTLGTCSATQCGTTGTKSYTCQPTGATCSPVTAPAPVACSAPDCVNTNTVTYTPIGDWDRTTTKTVIWQPSFFNSNVEVWLCTKSNATSGMNVKDTADEFCPFRLDQWSVGGGSTVFSVPTLAINNTTYYFYVRQAGNTANDYPNNVFSSPVIVRAHSTGSLSGQGCIEGTCVCVNGTAKRCGNPMTTGVGCPAVYSPYYCSAGVSVAPGDRLVASVGALFGRVYGGFVEPVINLFGL